MNTTLIFNKNDESRLIKVCERITENKLVDIFKKQNNVSTVEKKRETK